MTPVHALRGQGQAWDVLRKQAEGRMKSPVISPSQSTVMYCLSWTLPGSLTSKHKRPVWSLVQVALLRPPHGV